MAGKYGNYYSYIMSKTVKMAVSKEGLFFTNRDRNSIDFISLRGSIDSPVDNHSRKGRSYTALPFSLPYEVLSKSEYVKIAGLTHHTDTLFIALKLVAHIRAHTHTHTHTHQTDTLFIALKLVAHIRAHTHTHTHTH